MPSEAQCQEPRDRGPPPPVTRAKAAATSPAPERRPRGRPRKDGSSTPPTPPPPTPPLPPPAPKSRKKGRSRGRAQVEDEESMDATERKPPPKTEVKETLGRRRSTSRRKSSTYPEPSPDRLSPPPPPVPEPIPDPPTVPEPSPDPPVVTEPSPDHPAVQEPSPDLPTVTEPSSEPAPSVDEEDRTGPGSATPVPEESLGPASGPTGEPGLNCPPPSPHAPSSPSPAPHPVEEDRPGLVHHPVPVDCGSGPVPTATEGGGASPVQSSPCSSPLVSPCPRQEDEDSLSLLFQNSPSEDSGGSPTPSLGETEKRLKQCAFCYRGDDPPLGQGRLVVFGPTPGYIPLHILSRRASTDRDSDCHDHCYRGNQAPPTCISPDQCEDKSSSEFVEQLGAIGLPHDINVQSLFDPTGQCCAHLQCAAWSEGVCRGEGQSLLYVDKAIDSGSTQLCLFCHRLGATLHCRETGCTRSYHFPCAAAAGAHQDWSQKHTHCPQHTHTVSSRCVLCSGRGDISGLLICCCCGNCYHGSCLDPPLNPSPLCRAGWQCPECRVCQSCRLRGEDGVLLVCERCDKAYHTHCLTPPLEHSPGTWSCKNCRVCRRCGVRSSGQWANHPFLCESCDPALPCPVCGHAPNRYSPQEYVTCICCYRCVHMECVVQAGEGRAGSEGYVCSTCRTQEEELISHSPTPALPHSPTQEPVPNHTEAPPISPTAHSPVKLICSDPAHSPTKATCSSFQQSPAPPQPDPTELQQSPTPPQPDPTELQQSPTPPQPDPTELQQSPTPPQPDPTELQQSPTPPQPDPTELQQSPTPPQPDPTELQQSPTPPQPDPTELQQSPTPPQPDPTELQQSPTPPQSDPTELQQSPTPPQSDPTELQQSPTPPQPDPTEPQQSPTPPQPDPTELQQSPTSPQPDPTELQQSPTSPQPDPTELQQSPTPPQPDPTELQQSPTSPQPDPTELQQSPTPPQPDPTELQQSPTPPQPDPTELQQSPTSPQPDPTEPQQIPTPPQPDPTELQQSPTPPQPDPTELQQSPTPPQPDPTELQQSPTSPQPDPTELQQSPTPPQPDPTELQQSPTPPQPDPTELQQSPTPPQPDPTELQQSPTPPQPDPTEAQQSPTPPQPDPTEPQQSPTPPQPDPTELQQVHTPPQPDPTEAQQSPTPPQPDPTEAQQSPTPPQPDPTELQQSPTPPQPDPTELQQIHTPPQPDPTELQQSPTSPQPDPTEAQQSPTPPQPDPTELQQSPTSPQPDPTEAQQSPTPPQPNPTELQQSSTSPQPDPTELQQSSTSPHADATKFQESPAPCKSGPTEHQESHTTSHLGPAELQQVIPSPPGPAELQQSSSHVTSTQAQHSPCWLSYTPSSPIQNSTDQFMAAQSQLTPTKTTRSHATSPYSQTQLEYSPTRFPPGPADFSHSLPPRSPAQDIITQLQLHRSQPQHSPTQTGQSLNPCSPAQVCTSPPQSPTQHAEPTLDQETPGSSSPAQLSRVAAQNISTLDQGLSTPNYNFGHTTRNTSVRPISAPCSPSPSPLGPVRCSLSQPASPGQGCSSKPVSLLPFQLATQARATESPNVDGQTLESRSTPLSDSSDLSTTPPPGPSSEGQPLNQPSPVQSSPPHVPFVHKPESLFHISTSVEHGSLTCSPCANETKEIPPPDSLSCCTEAITSKASPVCSRQKGVSPTHASDLPPSPVVPVRACDCPGPTVTIPAHVSPVPAENSHITQRASTVPRTDSCPLTPTQSSSQPASPSAVDSPIHPGPSKDEDAVAAADPLSHFIQSGASSDVDSPLPASSASTDAHGRCILADSLQAQEKQSLSVCSFQSSPSHIQTSCSPSEPPTSPLPSLTGSSPLHCRLTDASPASGFGSSLSTLAPDCSHGVNSSTPSVRVTDVNFIHSPPRSSPAGHASPLHFQNTTISGHPGPIQRQTPPVSSVSPPQSPPQASETNCSPCSNPAPDTEASSGLTVAQQSPTLASPSLDVGIVVSSSSPHLDTGLVIPTDISKQAEPGPAGSLPDDESAVNQTSVSQKVQSLTSPAPAPNTALVSPLYQGQAVLVDATSTQASPSYASPVNSGPTQDYTAMPSPPRFAPPQVGPDQTLSSHAPQTGSVHSSPDSIPVWGPLQYGNNQTTLSLGPSSPVQPRNSPSPGLASPVSGVAGHGSNHVRYVLATSVHPETSSGPTSPERLDPDSDLASLVVPAPQQQQQAGTGTGSAASDDVVAVQELELHQESSEEEPAEGGAEPEQEEQSCSNEPPSGGPVQNEVLQPPAQTAAAPSQPVTPDLALPPHQPSPLPSPQSPPPRAGSWGSCPVPSPHRTALPLSCSPSPPPEDRPQEQELANHVRSAVDDSQSQSLFKPVAVATEPTKDKQQTHTKPSEKGAEPPGTPTASAVDAVAVKQPMREKQDAEEEEGVSDEEEEEEARRPGDQSDVEEEEPLRPLLDLDPSLDMEVMELMTSSSPPPSLLHLSSPSPPPTCRGRSLRPPPRPSRPSDDLSVRLRQSPFSAEASPETSPARAPVTPPPLYPPSPPLRSPPPPRESPPLSKPQVPPTVLPLTPKIGMGKPAITKRKFSPGRARVKQGSWWSNRRVVSPPSSSQDSMGEGGWDSPKPRLLDSPLWSMRVGRGSGFPGRRRSRGGGVGRGGRGRSRLKIQESVPVSPGSVCVESFQVKEEEENSMHNTVVMFSTSDHFTLRQDMCVVCGSFGHGAEGRLLACSQCGQCYHPYCVNVKITRVILTKGWRCLECTVCEACGEASDPGRLLLCDDCDISYHTYCLAPPLLTVPQGAWKCQWCVWCVQCGSSSPGVLSDWQQNYSRCGPCSSLVCCPVCSRQYCHDELVLQCQQCDRWVHAVCQGLTTEEEVEVMADEGFTCSLCRTHGCSSYDSPFMAQIVSRIKEPETKTYTQDGVCLTESGLNQLQSLVEPLTSPRRNRRCKPKLKLRIINQNSVSVLQTPEPPTQDLRGDLECEMKSDSSPERDHAHNDDLTKEPEVTDGNKKRKRKPYRPGIGGFMVRQRGGKTGLSRVKLFRNDSAEPATGGDEGVMDADVSMETMEKVKKRYRKKKTKLEETFPSYLQEAFFGRSLLDLSRQVDRKVGADTPGSGKSGAAAGGLKGPAPWLHGPSPSGLTVGAMATNRKKGTLPGLDVGSMSGDLSVTSEVTGSGRVPRSVQEEPLDAILSPELDKMVTDGAILSKLYKIPELEGKDVEEVFTAVLSPSSGQSEHSKTHTQHTAAAGVFPRLPLLNGLMGSTPSFPNPTLVSGGSLGPCGVPGPVGSFRTPRPDGPAPGPASTNQASAEGEQDVLSTAQRSMLKWEKEEALGETATVAPVLYCNTNYPQLREQFPDWSTRVKQIAKLWRKASSQDRAPYVQKARDNRAAQRINKVQLSNEPIKRLPPSQQPPPPPPGPYDPVTMETELAFMDPLRPKESEQEQEWKFRQQMRQQSKHLAKMEATQKLEQVKNEQRQQLLANQSVAPVTQQPVAGGNASPLQPREVQLSGLADSVFVRPQAPPPSGYSSRPHSPHASSPLHQPPSSPQMFSPPSSRPSSPWDPYNKAAAPPRQNSSSQGAGPPAPLQQQRCNSLGASPDTDTVGSPGLSPDSKTCSTFRTLGPQLGVQQTRPGMLSPPSGSTPDHPGRPSPVRAAETFQRTQTSNSLHGDLQGGLFKAPMPPQHQAQEVFGSAGGVRRDPPRPTDLGFALPQSQDPSFPSSPLSGLSSPHRSPYAQTPGTPRPDCIQQIPDSLTSRPSPDPYTNAHTPGTPRPHSDPAYLSTPPVLRLDKYNQQMSNCRPPPSLPTLDPYVATPGPRPPVVDRFPRSPGSQRSSDPYAQQPSTPRPPPDPYSQQPSTPRPLKAPESFSPAPDTTVPLAPGVSGESFTQTHHQSPGRRQQQQQQQQDSFSRTLSSQTPKHPGMSDESSFPGLINQSPGHDTFEQGHMTPGPSQTDKTPANEMAALSVASLDGTMSMIPQLGDSEEKLRQRQRLRQLILRQQQQKSALRQEKGLQEPPPAPAGPNTPRPWPQDSSSHSTPPPADLFGRPPPPYPGKVRPAGAVGSPTGPQLFPAGFAGEQQRCFLPRDLGVRGPALRFGVSPGAPAVLQEAFLRPPTGVGLRAAEGVAVQMRRPMPNDFTGIRLLTAPNATQQLMPGPGPGGPQPFLSRPLPLQQHSIMGQPYIELRHRVPENRLRVPLALAGAQDPEALPVHPQLAPARPGPGAQMGEGPLGQQMLLTSGVEHLNQQDQQHLGNVADSALPGSDGIEEHLEDSAVKDLEDVEVKDLVDLNLNLDPEDGKEDLDLGPNDLHLDDILLSGKFDLIAYTDPELNLEDKKDMFNEELDLGEPAEEKEGGLRRDTVGGPPKKVDHQAHLIGQVKQEVEDNIKTEAQNLTPQPGTTRRPPAPPGLPEASSLPGSEEQLEDTGSGPRVQDPGSVSRVQPLSGQLSMFQQQRPAPPGPLDPPQPPAPPNPQSLLTQTQTKPLLLEEQPLLLQDLLDQERQEQQRQKQMQVLIRPKTTSDPGFPNMDFDSISDPIMKAKIVALKGINKVMTQGNLTLNRFQQAPPPDGSPQASQQQDGKLNPQLLRPNPPSFSPGFINEAQQRQYEEWLGETQKLLQMQQRLLEDQIAAHRKTKKALSAKQRTARKAGRVLGEDDQSQLRYITEQQGAVQRQLEQIRKQQKDHSELIEDYRTKQQQRGAPPFSQTLIPQSLVPLPNVPPGWTPGGGASGVRGQRVPPLLPPQMPSAPPNPPQASPHTQTPPAPPPSLGAPPPRFPTGVPNGPAGDGTTAAAPQVKFDDNNPFSEGFQERERRERLREQQERQRVQLLQEVERHRVLQQRLDLEQQGLLGGPLGPGAPAGPGAPPGDSLSQMSFFSSELPQDFLQSPPASRPVPQVQVQAGAPFLQQGFVGRGRAPPEHGPFLDVVSSSLQTRPRLPSTQGPEGGAGTPPSLSGGHRLGQDSSSSSPSTPLPHTGGPASLLQLYADILPEDKPKKKRSRKRDSEESGGGARTPLSSQSDDITAPPTPVVSDASCCTPPLPDLPFPQSRSLLGLAPSSELERQLSAGGAQERSPVLGMEEQRGPPVLEVKEEREEPGACSRVKLEEAEGGSSPLPGEAGKELLRHLLKDKASSPAAGHRQLSSDEEDRPSSHGNAAVSDSPDRDPDPSCRDQDPAGRKKPQRCKRAARPEKERAPPKTKRRRREEEEELPADPLTTHLRQLSVLPLMEPVLGVDLTLFPPYGSSVLGRDSRLRGAFGSGCLEGVSDYYSQLIYKQNNLSNPPTPPASLPPTPPPVARQKLLNGFATTEELREQEVKSVCVLKQKGEDLLALTHLSKTVDVPASLPTPPHTNQEELRVQDSDGFVPSSSPESVADLEVSRYPDLSFIKMEPPSPCPSPPIPIMPCTWGKGSAVKQEVKAEPTYQAPSSCSSTELVTIAITLNPVVAQNVAGVMAAVAELLRVPTPANYHLSHASNYQIGHAPERSALSLLAGVRVPQGAAVRQQQKSPPTATNTGFRMDYNQHGGSATATRPQCCSTCKVLLGNGVGIIRELKQEGQSTPGSSLVFCSPDCSTLYTSGRTAGNKGSSRGQHQYTNNVSSIAVHALPPSVAMETRPRTDSLKVKVKLKPRPRAVPEGDDSSMSHHGKKVKSSRWRRWSISITLTRGPCVSSEVVSMPTEEEVDVLLEKLGACLRPDPLPRDQRRCCFCHQLGDGPTDGPARLLNLDLDLWVHLNCALWSSEVYETQAGALINVEPALRRGLTVRCAHCQKTGATSGCNRLRCTNTYHFTCALQARCTFFKDKTMLCHLHKPRVVPVGGDRSSGPSPSSTPGPAPDLAATSDPYDSELRCFAVFRRVFVQRDEARQIAAVVQRGERQHTFRVGSLLFRAIGRLLPQQMNAFHNQAAIFPVGYHANRIYWSMRHSNRRCRYMCYIEEQDGRPLFKVKVVEKGHDDVTLTGATPKAVWDQVLEPVSQMRSSSGTLKLFPVYLKGEDLFGLTTSAVSRIIESLPGVEACERYTFRYGRNPLMEWPLAFNPTGSARSEPKPYQAKRLYLSTNLAPRVQGSVGSIVGLVPGVLSLSPGESVAGLHHGRHSKSSQYRRMKAEWKSNVYLARSRIQGLGLYAARDIEKCTMVIEYIGTIIRSEVANRKERLYEAQNRGVYMFRIDNDFVIDATITGGPARYINHSCGPNCITEVVTVEKENKIIISSCRRIQRGEELSYDYKFDLEDDQHKIPCHCGAVNCRKWMN